ncbi:unnamed protein product, partial [Timema podura]|nr:unnamed protein product [Timema podura]
GRSGKSAGWRARSKGPGKNTGNIDSRPHQGTFEQTKTLFNARAREWILRAGEGPQVPEGASVTVHYNAYLEFNEEPYDSTYMRGKPETFRLNAYQLIQGLEIGIATMKKKEKSQFLISPELAYKELGVPPRIPGSKI